MILKCLIIDDEPLAHKVLENYIEKHNNLEKVGNFHNALDALSYLMEHKVDLLFLDINMPELSGLDMLRTMDDAPTVILTTAYSEYALESYEVGVADYLMKPIRFDRFLKAVNKVLKARQATHTEAIPEKEKITSIFIKVDGVQQKVNLSDLEYIESRGNFIQLFVKKEKYLTAETLSNIDKKLRDSGFLRIHKSYIINLEKVTSFKGTMVQVGEKLIPIGNSYRQIVLKELGM